MGAEPDTAVFGFLCELYEQTEGKLPDEGARGTILFMCHSAWVQRNIRRMLDAGTAATFIASCERIGLPFTECCTDLGRPGPELEPQP